MAKLYSHKEHESMLKEKKETKVPERVFEQKKDHALPAPDTEYFFLYPDNPKSGYYSGKYIMMHNDETIHLDILDGVIKTTNKDIAEHLRSKGFVFMYENKIGEKENG